MGLLIWLACTGESEKIICVCLKGPHPLLFIFSPKEVIWSIVALSRLQNVWEYDNKDDTSSHSSNHDVTALDMQRLEELAHYCIFANAAYGWKGFAFCGRWRVLGGSDRVLVRSTGIDRRDIVATNWHSKANRPVGVLSLFSYHTLSQI